MAAKPAWSRTARTGPMRRFQNLSVFACEGLIAVCDERPQYEGAFTVVTPADMRRRITAAAAPYRNQTRAQLPKWQQQEHDAIHRGCAAIAECIKEAQAMGDPSDPAVQAFWRRHSRNSTVALSAGTDAAGYPTLPPLPLGEFTGRTVAVDGVLHGARGKQATQRTLPPELMGGKILHRPPRKKNRAGIIEL